MKISSIIHFNLLFGILFLTCSSAFGQELSKKEKKALKKEKKSLSVEEFKTMIKQEQSLLKKNEKIKKEISQEKQHQKIEKLRISTLGDELIIIDEEIQKLQKEIEIKNPVPTQKQVEVINEQKVETRTGVYFKVQIGAFLVKNSALYDDMLNICKTKDIDLRKRKIYINRCMDEYFSIDNKFNYQGRSDGSISRDQSNEYKKYLVGYFGDYWEADNFKRLLRKMGVDRAWIVPYINENRVKLEQIIEEYPNLIFGSR